MHLASDVPIAAQRTLRLRTRLPLYLMAVLLVLR
jgi:hypothetical protein